MCVCTQYFFLRRHSGSRGVISAGFAGRHPRVQQLDVKIYDIFRVRHLKPPLVKMLNQNSLKNVTDLKQEWNCRGELYLM